MKLIVFPLYVTGQGVIISSGIYMHLSDGTMVLHGNWENNGNYSDTLSTIILNDTTQQEIGGSSSTEFTSMHINNSKGVIGSQDFRIEGILNLESPNASDTTGSLDMGANTLTMGAFANDTGVGDVTGIIRRTTIYPGVIYTFGSKHMTAYFNNVGTLPSEMSARITIGTAPSWRPGAIKREIEIIQTGGSGTKAMFSYHYLDSELNGNIEDNLVFWVGLPTNFEYGRSSYNKDGNWVVLSNVNVAFFSSSWDGNKDITLDEYSTITRLTWNGSLSNSWTSVENWTPNAGPSSNKDIVIPDASTTPNDPYLPSITEIKSLEIKEGGILNADSDAQLTINGDNGAWLNIAGTFSPNTSNVIFSNVNAVIGGTTNFYNVTIPDTVVLWLTNESTMRIAGAVANDGAWRTVIGGPTTVEYNGGNQTVVVPNPATNRYSTLILSGSGTKTMPGTTLEINKDFILQGTATADAGADLNINGNFSIGSGATFNTGAYNHSVGGNFTNNNAFNSTSGNTLTFNGTSAQTIGGTVATTFNDLTSNNAIDVTLTSSALTTVAGTLTINSGKQFSVAPGKQLSVDGTIANNAGASGFTLHSGVAGTASLLHNTNNVQATVQRYISGTKEAWHFISSPVAAQGISGSWLPSGSYGNGTGYDLYLWNEPNNCWIYKLNTTSAINWNTVHPGSNFTPGRGYLYSVQATNPTKAFIGNLNNGSITYPLSTSSDDLSLKGFNFVGNPYPSSIDWQASLGWTRSNLVNSGGGYDMWIWNPIAENYGVCNSATGICTNSVTRNIAPMQGFFVRASGAGNLGMDNAVRLHDNGTWFKNSEINTAIFRVVVESEADKSLDEAGLLFGYSANEPGARKLFSNIITAPSLFMSSGDENYSVRYFTDTTDNHTVPLKFIAGRDGNYSLKCNFDLEKFTIVMLEDRKTNYIQNMIPKNTYSFSASTTDDENRFVLHFGPDKNAHYSQLPARIYTSGNQVIVDLTLISNQTEVFLYDAMGRLILENTLQGLKQHKLSINAPPQILLVYLQNQQGNFNCKLFYTDKNE
jgi:hypothetical protein